MQNVEIFSIYCIVTWNLLFWPDTDHFLYEALELVYSMQNYILVITILISVLNCSV